MNGEDLHDVSGVLKSFFSDLPEPVFPFNAYDEFTRICRIDSEEERIDLYIETLKGLPNLNAIVIRFFFEFLHTVSLASEVNKMTPANLGTCLGPSLMRPEVNTPDQMMLALEKTVVEQLVENYPIIFEEIGLQGVSKDLLKAAAAASASSSSSVSMIESDRDQKKKKWMNKVSSKRFTTNFRGSKAQEQQAQSQTLQEPEQTHFPPGQQRPMSFHSVNLSGGGPKDLRKVKSKNRFGMKK